MSVFIETSLRKLLEILQISQTMVIWGLGEVLGQQEGVFCRELSQFCSANSFARIRFSQMSNHYLIHFF